MRARTLRFCLFAAILLGSATALTNAADQPVAPGKFIPTFAVKYGGSTGWPELRDAAKYDLIAVGGGSARAKADPAIPGNTWQVLKKMNPHMTLVLYQIGPAEYNTADWGRIGQGWKWIAAEHGAGSADRWIAIGTKYGTPLQSTPYPHERLMLPGNPNWQQYWLDSVYAGFWGDPAKPTAVADGIFSDNTRYSMIWKGQWRREGSPETVDIPSDYYQDGKFNEALYHQHMKSYFARAFPWMEAKGRKLVLNFGDMAREAETWVELDNEPSAPFGAMEEGAFVNPWTSKKNTFVVLPEKDWLTQVETMRKLKHVRPLMNVHGPVVTDAKDFSRMEASDAAGRKAWDVLWYAMTSFLQGYDDTRQNAYMNFTLWGYTQFYWFKEFDPHYLHLGRARGDYRKVEGRTGHVYMREFEDGWAVVNPTDKPAEGVAVPAGEARVIEHATLEKPETSPLVKTFDLPAQRGIVLLKAGRAIGNSDNQ